MGGNCFNKKSNNNAQGGQSRVNPTPVNSAESNYASAARTIPNGTNVQPQYHGGSDVPVANANAKSSESSAAQRSTRVVPKAPASQPPSVSSDSAPATTPAKESSCDAPNAISSKGKKKRREILQRAEAAGSTSDLYNAYKGPEEKKEAVVSSENTKDSKVKTTSKGKKKRREILQKAEAAGPISDLYNAYKGPEEKKEAVVSSENTKDSKVKTTSKGKKKRREILQKAETAGSTSDLYNAYKGPDEKKEAVVSSENTKDSKLKTNFKGKKKRREILQKAEAAGSTSDLYNAYKEPEEKKEAVVSSENTVSVSISGNLKQLPMDTAWTDAIVNEQCGQKKTELDDWEDAADMSTPKLEVSDKTQQVGDGSKVTAKKYSRDFLLKFAGQCTDLPERFEITAGIAEEKKEAVVSSENTKDSKLKTTSKGKKKRKEILQKAEAAGSTSDLYNAYKGPEEKKEAVLSSENTVSVSTSGNLKQLPMDAAWTDAIVNEQCEQKKTELDDWEDAADMSTPKLEVSDKTQQVGDGSKVTAKKYSRDFLLKFAGQCTDLPERFEITAGIAEEKKEAVVSSENTKDSKLKTTSKGKKKRKEILQKAEAAGSTSDLYNAYKGPEEKKEAVLSSENTVSVSTSGNLKQLPMDAAWTDAIVNEQCEQKKTELDDWEDAADMSTPKLEVSDKTQQVGDGSKVTAKKYSRDFLLKFAGQCTDLPERFEIMAGIAEALMSSNISSHVIERDSHPSTGRITDRSCTKKKKRRKELQIGQC